MRSQSGFFSAAWASLLAGSIACGAPRPPSSTPVAEPALEQTAGVRLLALPRPRSGGIHLSMWVDAGSRDARPAQTATVAAWALAAAAGGGVSARCLPDGIEFTLDCPPGALSRCLARMSRVLGATEISPSALTAALERLPRDRRRARADRWRRSDALALEALLGGAVDPLGDPDDDAQVDAQAVGTFLRAHFGRDRALVIAVGEVSSAALRGAAAEVFSQLREAGQARAVRAAPRAASRVRVGDVETLSIATVLPSPAAAMSTARRWIARVRRHPGVSDASADAFPLRGGVALVVRGRGRPGVLVHRLQELLEPPGDGGHATPRLPDDPTALARWRGARWTAGEPAATGGFGVGWVTAGGRGDRLETDRPDAAERRQAEQALARLLGETQPEPDATGVTHLPNGATLQAENLPGAHNVAVAVLFAGGAREEPARAHGVTALLSRASALECVNRAAEELGAPAAALGIEVRPHLTPSHFGVVVSGPRTRWADVSYLAARCARPPTLSADAVRRARIMSSGVGGLYAALAEAISPDAPGRITPSPAGLASVTPEELRRWRDRVAVGARARVGLAGDIPLGAALRRLAPMIGRFPAGAPPAPGAWAGPPPTLRAARGSPIGAWVIHATQEPRPLEPALRLFTRSLARSLAASPLTVVAQHHGVVDGVAFAAVFVRAREQDLARLPTLVSAIPPATPTPGPAPTTPNARAIGLALGELSARSDDATAFLERLRATTPSFVIVRPGR